VGLRTRTALDRRPTLRHRALHHSQHRHPSDAPHVHEDSALSARGGHRRVPSCVPRTRARLRRADHAVVRTHVQEVRHAERHSRRYAGPLLQVNGR